MPINKEAVHSILGSAVQPYNLDPHFTLTETGERVENNRLNQDLFRNLTIDNALINSRSDVEQYQVMIYGLCLIQIMQYICVLRLKYPDEQILIIKHNFSDAYW